MQFVTFVCVLFVAAVLVHSTDARKTSSTGRKSGGSSRRSGTTNFKHKQVPPPVKPHKTDPVNTNFLNSERAGSSHSSVNTHFRGDPFKKAPEAPKHNTPKNNGQIGFEKVGNQGNQKLGFDQVNSEVLNKPSNSYVPSAPVYSGSGQPYPSGISNPVKPVPSAPIYPDSAPSYPAKPVASAPAYPSGVPSYPAKPLPSAPIYPDSAPSYPAKPVASAPAYPSGVPSYPVKPLPSAPVYPDSAPSYPAKPVPSAPVYPSYPSSVPYPSKQIASAPFGPPPVYPGYGANTHSSGFEAPPAYPGRPVNAPPVYSPSNVDSGQRNPIQPSGFSYPNQQNNYQVPNIGQSNPGQHNNFMYPNTGNNLNSFPSQGYNNGYMFRPGNSYGNSHVEGYGQSYSGYNGYPYGVSQPNPYGGSPFSSSFGNNPISGNYPTNPYYSPSNFGFSNNPGYFGSSSPQQGYPGNQNNYGYHKKSRFGGLPIPIPIPIPIPSGLFGGFGGSHSHNHNLLDTFIKGKNISSAENTTTSVFILNNSTVAPCTTDQFIYSSLNVTVVSCTADNCTAVKVFTTTNVSGELTVHSALLTMCLEPNATYSSHAENVHPIISDVHNYWMRVCNDVGAGNNTGNFTKQTTGNATLNVNDLTVNETHSNVANSSIDPSSLFTISTTNEHNTTLTPSSENSTLNQPLSLMNSSSNEYNITSIASSSPFDTTFNSTRVNSTLNNSTGTYNSSQCEIVHCSWIDMCLPSMEIIDQCDNPECNKTKTAYEPCVRIKMCKSPSTPISTFATINTTISRTDQFNNVSTVNDVANLTLISYISPTLPANYSQNVTDSDSLAAPLKHSQDVCAAANATEAAAGEVMSKTNKRTVCIIAPVSPEGTNSTSGHVTTTLITSATPTDFIPNNILMCLCLFWTITNNYSFFWKQTQYTNGAAAVKIFH